MQVCPHCESSVSPPATDAEEDEREAVEQVEDSTEEQAESEEPKTCGHGRYQIIRTIGQGGMGAIYQAFDTKLKINIALKRLLPTAEEQEAGVERFLREAQAIAALNHFNIIRIFDVNEDEEGYYIAMEFVEGDSLKERIRKEGKLDVETTIRFTRQIAQGLAYAHKREIIHRDIKPANILLGEDDVPKIVDFGLAAVASGDELSKTGYGMGTLSYMPPEQKTDAKSVDQRADIYALGATMYEMVTGQSPSMIREKEIPLELRDIIFKCVDPDREQRYQSCEELIAALDSAVSHAPEAASDSSIVAGLPPCPSCGAFNREDVRFCQKCGGGLFQECPHCGNENRIGAGFCGSCGLDLKDYNKAQEFIEEARKLINQNRYGEAIKAAQKAVDLLPDYIDAQKVLARAKELEQLFNDHRKQAQDLIKQSRYEEAQKHLEEALKLRPEDKGIAKALEVIPQKIRERDIRLAIQRAGELIGEEKFEEAAEAYDEALRLAPKNKSVAKIVQKGKKRLAKERDRFVERTLAKSAKEIEAKNFGEAEVLLRRVCKLAPDNAKAKKLYSVAKKGHGAQRRQEADQLLAEADQYIKSRRYEIALARVQSAAELCPDRSDIQQKLKEVRELMLVRNMCYVEGGEFIFGDAKQGLLRRPYKMTVAPFYIDKFPVTNAEYARFCKATRRPPPSHWPNGEVPRGQENHPVCNVSFNDAKAYAKWVGKRLPTEEEWEKAARGTDGRKYPWGNEMDESMCNNGANGTTPVDKYTRGQSVYGCVDMVGNVWEWCDSRYGSDDRHRFRRGGLGHKLGCTSRKPGNVNHPYMDSGFRCALDAKNPPKK